MKSKDHPDNYFQSITRCYCIHLLIGSDGQKLDSTWLDNNIVVELRHFNLN